MARVNLKREHREIIDEIVDDRLEGDFTEVSSSSSSEEWLAALEYARDKITDWLEASIEAAKDDVKRAK